MEILDLIGRLHAVERGCPGSDPAACEETRTAALELRTRRRHGQSNVEAIRASTHHQRTLPESSLGKAIAYTLGLWAGLTRFLDDTRIRLDNNATERRLRGLVVGRKNDSGSRSQRGAEVAAAFYCLIESAMLCGVEPKAYLLQATRAAPRETLVRRVRRWGATRASSWNSGTADLIRARTRAQWLDERFLIGR